MEPETVFRYQYNKRIVMICGAAGAVILVVVGLNLYPWLRSGLVPPVSELLGLAAAVFPPLMAHLSQRRSSRDTWVRVHPNGLTVSSSGKAAEEIGWTQIASIATDYEPGDGFADLSISTHDGRTVEVDNGIVRGDELCQAIWDTGLFVSDGEAGATRWVPKQPEPLPAPDGEVA